MNLETVMNDVKSKMVVVQGRAQDVAEVSVDTFKQASDVVLNGVQVLVKTHTETATELFGYSKASFEKAKADGIAAVVSNPVIYMPEGRDKVVAAFNDTLTTFTKTGEDLAKVILSGYEGVASRIQGEVPVVKKAKKTARKASASAKTATSKARKTTASKARSAKKSADATIDGATS